MILYKVGFQSPEIMTEDGCRGTDEYKAVFEGTFSYIIALYVNPEVLGPFLLQHFSTYLNKDISNTACEVCESVTDTNLRLKMSSQI